MRTRLRHSKPIQSKGHLSLYLATTTVLLGLSAGPVLAQSPATVDHPSEDRPNRFSVKSLSAYVAKNRAERLKERAERHKEGKTALNEVKKEEDEDERYDYYEAWLYRYALRAFPNDSVDPAAILRAGKQRDAMKPAFIGTSAGGNGVSINALVPVVTPPAVPSGAKWEFVGPRNFILNNNYHVSGRVNGITFSPTDPNTIYLASAGGGPWKTTDGGKNWSPLGDTFPTMTTSSVAVSPADSQLVLVGLGDFDGYYGVGPGIMRSTDGGTTWNLVGTGMANTSISALVFDPDNPQVIVATAGRLYNRHTGNTNGRSGIYRSTDGGLTWTLTKLTNGSAIPDGGEWSDVKVGIKGANGIRYYYASDNYDGFYRSSDSGATWVKLTPPAANPGELLRVAPSAVDANIVYIVDPSKSTVYKGVRNTATDTYTWTNIKGALNINWGQGWYDSHLLAAPQVVAGTTQDVLYIGQVTLAALPGTNAWQDIAKVYTGNETTHPDQHCLAYYPGDPNRMVIGNDGGAYTVTYAPSSSGVGTWNFARDTSKTLGLSQFYSADYHPTNPSIMLAGAQDNTTAVASGDLNNWFSVIGGDGCGVAINPVNPTIQYGSYVYMDLYRTTNSWSSISSISPYTSNGVFDGDGVAFVSVFSLDPTNPNLLYAATDHLWRFDSSANTWTPRLGNTLLSSSYPYVISIAVAPTNSQVIYVGTADGQLWVSRNAGTNWTKLPGLPNRALTSISVNSSNQNEILVGVGGIGTGHVFQCKDTTVATPVFTNISGTGTGALPDIQVNSVTRDIYDTDLSYYIGTDVGVFMTTDGGTTWTNATAPLGLPNVEVDTVTAVSGTSYLMASTYGRGVWRLPLVDPIPGGPILGISPQATRSGSQYTVSLNLLNSGTRDAAAVKISYANVTVGKFSFLPDLTVQTLPISLGTVAKGATVSAPIVFNIRKQTPNTNALITVAGTYTYGKKSGKFQLTVPVLLP